jgi:transposase InsO family protein
LTCSYRFISEHRTTFAVALLCKVLGVRRPGFYEWLTGEPARAARAAAEEELAPEIAEVHAEHRSAYGSRVTVELRRRAAGWSTTNASSGSCASAEIAGITRRRRRSLTKQDTAAAPAPDVIRRDFTADAPGERFVGDITYLPTQEGWLSLATVLDLHTREVAGHAMAEHMRAELVCDAVDLAARLGMTSADAIFHSDRGSGQYTSSTFRAELAQARMRPSMGRVGSCYDNAVAESFFATLKTEIGTQVWATRDDARRAVFAYLGYYNHDRLHSTLGYRTLHETRMSYRQSIALAA